MTPEKELSISHTAAPNTREIPQNNDEWFIRGIDIIPPNSHRTTPRPLPEDKTHELTPVDPVHTTQNNDNWLD